MKWLTYINVCVCLCVCVCVCDRCVYSYAESVTVASRRLLVISSIHCSIRMCVCAYLCVCIYVICEELQLHMCVCMCVCVCVCGFINLLNTHEHVHYRHESVAYLETDIGQCEFTPPGMVSLHIVTQSLFGIYIHVCVCVCACVCVCVWDVLMC